MPLPDETNVFYVVARVRSDRIIYAGPSLFRAAESLEPGTVYAKSTVKKDAGNIAHLRVEREKERLKGLEKPAEVKV